MEPFELHRGDCLEVLKTLPDNHVHSGVIDPPYGLSDHKPEQVVACLTAWLAGEPYAPKGTGFMGAAWDAWVPGPEVWRELLRVLKPGGHVMVFAGTRSMDLMCMALRLAGFEMRDAIGYAHDDEGGELVDGAGAPLMAWVYGQGFPKSLNVAKAIESGGGRPEDIRRMQMGDGYEPSGRGRVNYDHGSGSAMDAGATDWEPASDAAKQWEGWGTAMKPAWEPIILARKPLAKGNTVAANVLQHGTGALHIDGCRVHSHDSQGYAYTVQRMTPGAGQNATGKTHQEGVEFVGHTKDGRWPANVIHDGSDAVLEAFPEAPGQKADLSAGAPSAKLSGVYAGGPLRREGEPSANSENAGAVGFRMRPGTRRNDAGSAARFFYCAKASAADRNEGCDGLPLVDWTKDAPNNVRPDQINTTTGEPRQARPSRNHHPTVKPTPLLRYLQRLITPPGGITIDCYMGSGSSGKAAMLEGFSYIGMERDLDEHGQPLGYMQIAAHRIRAAHQHAIEAAARAQERDAQADLFGEEAA